MNELTTVRIMAINVTKHEAREILVVSTLEGVEDSMKRIRIYLKEDFWNYQAFRDCNHVLYKVS